MAVGLRMTHRARGFTSQTLPLIASMVTVNFGAATAACSCAPTASVQYTTKSVADCPGLPPNAGRYLDFAPRNRVARGLLTMTVDVDPFEEWRPPKINKGAYYFESSEKKLTNSSTLWDVTVVDPTSGEEYKLEITFEDDNFTQIQRDTIALSLGMLPARDRIDLYERLRSAPVGNAQAALLAGAVLDYTRASATLAKEVRDCARLYSKIRTDLVSVTNVDYTDGSVRMDLKCKPTFLDGVHQDTEMVKEIYRRLSEEADCQLGEEGNCPDWVERLALLEPQFQKVPGLVGQALWRDPTAWELE